MGNWWIEFVVGPSRRVIEWGLDELTARKEFDRSSLSDMQERCELRLYQGGAVRATQTFSPYFHEVRRG